MAHILEDRVLESTTTTGTGALTLAGAVTGFRRFNAVCAISDTVPYFIEALDSVSQPTGDYEYGVGTYSGANQLTRTLVLGSSNGGAAVSFAAGTKNVGIAMNKREVDYRTREGFRNRVINGNFIVNQRNAASGSTVYAAGAYILDRWKAGAGGCTMSWANSGGVVTVTITAGTLVQVIKGTNLQSGTHVLSWTGTAQGKVDAGSYGATGQTATATGGTNMTLEFNTGTLSLVQLEPGTVATTFEHRLYDAEFALCRRYRRQSNQANPTGGPIGAHGGVFNASSGMVAPVGGLDMQAVPTVTIWNNGVQNQVRNTNTGATFGFGTPSFGGLTANGFAFIGSSGTPAAAGTFVDFDWIAEAEL